MKSLLKQAGDTAFGVDHKFKSIHSYADFKEAIPLRDYEALKPYVDRVVKGEADVLWPGRPLYFSKTSGTTSGAKYIPISRDSMPHHIEAARNALLLYIAETGKSDFVDGKMIFLQGSPELGDTNGVATGRLSGIVAHHVPSYLQKNRLPSYETNCISDWETKVDRIIDETIDQPMSLISGIPSWVQHYFEKLIERAGVDAVSEVFPKFELFVYGGVNYEPYRKRFEQLIGKRVDSIETYPASEGFIAFQDSQHAEGLLLNTRAGIFFEFVPAASFFDENPPRLSLEDVELDTNYVVILNTNAGLWGYNIGDTVKFVSLNPYRVVVSGRIKHFTSAFGEHVIAEEVEYSMKQALEACGGEVVEFTVAPQLENEQGLPYHEWLIAFANAPADMDAFAKELDAGLCGKNIYYADLIRGKILEPLHISPLKPDAFHNYMKSVGKLGGQNKVPRLSNDRKIAEALLQWKQ